MLDWAQDQVVPARVAAGRRFPDAELVASELDPLATILARGHASIDTGLRDVIARVEGPSTVHGSPRAEKNTL